MPTSSPRGIIGGMTVVAGTRPPYADASPAEIRAALIPEEQVQFDLQYGRALEAAQTSYSLEQLERVLSAWRRVAAITTARGPDAHRRTLARAKETLDAGDLPRDSVPWSKFKSESGL